MGYSWGDDSGGDSSYRSSSSGYDYTSARKAYEEPPRSSSGSKSGRTSDSMGGGEERKSSRSAFASSAGESLRSHDFSSARGKTPWPIKREKVAVSTDSTHPGVVCADDTGSFLTEIQIILEKLPLLGDEWKRYMPAYKLCLTLIGDTASDRQPLQVQDFDSDEPLVGRLKLLFPEGLGGDDPESYDLAAYYFTNYCEMPNAVIKPLFIWIVDSTTRSKLLAKDIKKYIGGDPQSDLDSVEVLKKLAEKFSVWVILKGSYNKDFWARIYGEQRIIPLEEPRDIVEMIIAIAAGEAGKYEDFSKRVSARHSDKLDRISRVMKSTKSVRDVSAKATDVEAGAAKASLSKKAGSPSLKSKKLV